MQPGKLTAASWRWSHLQPALASASYTSRAGGTQDVHHIGQRHVHLTSEAQKKREANISSQVTAASAVPPNCCLRLLSYPCLVPPACGPRLVLRTADRLLTTPGGGAISVLQGSSREATLEAT